LHWPARGVDVDVESGFLAFARALLLHAGLCAPDPRYHTQTETYRGVVILTLAGVALGGAAASVAVAHLSQRERRVGDRRQTTVERVLPFLLPFSRSALCLSLARTLQLCVKRGQEREGEREKRARGLVAARKETRREKSGREN
jgi:hypothetical protein